ncbi:MAG TPA: hypothetical protein VGV59_19585, partial [Pyrinomonadaceae bacterium]|nr:hypothetical protein [Pyrinomonadaceae bacterium]
MSLTTVEHRCLKLLAFFTLFVHLSVVQTRAQEATQYDRGTPPQHAAGLGALGSYSSAELGTVNLSNGSLNFRLALGRVGGRGFALPLTLNYSSKLWSANMGEDVVNDPVFRKFKAVYAVYDNPETPTDYYQKVAPGWTLGAAPTLHAVGVPINSVQNNNGCSEALSALVKLTVLLPDKGEVELRDDQTDGSPLTAQPDSFGCRRMDGYRGQRWHATDGSGMVFINDVDNGVVNGNLNGTLITSEGVRYRFRDTAPGHFGSIFMNEFARADLVSDRQGNQIQISYSTLQTAPYTATIRFTDQLGRISTVELNAPDPANGSLLAALVTLPGFGGESRQYKVRKGVMNQHYRAGINPTLPVYNGDSPGREMNCTRTEAHTSLFGGSWCGGLERLDDREVLTELVLPGNRSLVFKYNEFGEVAEARVPTGGRVQYDYAYREALPSGNSPLFETVPAPGTGNVRQVDRAVIARRVLSDGQTTTTHWSYEYAATPGVGGAASNGVTEVIARASDNATVLAREKHYFMNAARFLDSNGGTGYALWTTGLERRSEMLNAAGTVLAAHEQDWAQRAPVNWGAFTAEQTANDNRVNAERHYLDDGKVSKVSILYDEFNNPTDVYEFDYGQGAPAAYPMRHTRTTYLRVNSSNGLNYIDRHINLLRLPETRQVYAVNPATGGETLVAQSQTRYDEAAYPTLTYAAVAGWSAPSTPARGNPTTARSWLDQTNSWIETHAQFDQTGNVRNVWDARGNRSQVSYEDSFSDGANARQTYAFPTQMTSPVPDPTGAHASNTPLVSSLVYDFSTGFVTASTDVNGQTTTWEFEDPLDRVTRVNLPGGGRTRYEYGDTAGALFVRTRTLLRETPSVEETDAYIYFDGFGRAKRSYVFDGTPATPWIATQTDYSPLGTVSRVSNPYRVTDHSVAGSPAHWTTSIYDQLGRVLTVTTPDGAVVKTEYVGNQVTVTDQAGKSRRTTSDAFGRLTQVVEDPAGLAYQTNFLYDALDNLRQIQQGAQQRFYMYNSLGQLIRAKNPEQSALSTLALSDPVTGNAHWSLAYSYDEAGNVRFRTDARNITTEYRFDALNRNIITLYPDTSDPANDTPDAERLYDGAPNGKGRPWQTWTWGQKRTKTVIGAYDVSGNPLVQYQYHHDGTQWGTAFAVKNEVNLAGKTVKQTYPSGRIVSYTHDLAGRLAIFSGNLAGTHRIYSSGLSYDDTGRLKEETFGTDTPLYHKLHYNVRGQLYDVRLSTYSLKSNEWDWNRGALVNYYSNNFQWGGAPGAHGSGADNNGNVLRSETFVPSDDHISAFTASRNSFSYDALNRLSSVVESRFTNWTDTPTPQFAQSYDFDRYGNRTINTSQTWGGIAEPQLAVDSDTNRLAVPAGQLGNMAYDPAGNLTNDSYTSYGTYDGTPTRLYDAENKLVKVRNGSLQDISAYTYDADGRRVRRKVGGQEVWQIYGINGELLAEYAAGSSPSSPLKEYGYRSGELLIVASRGAPQTEASTGGGTPYGGTPRTIPGTIEAEHYDEGGEGVGYHDTTAGNSGLNYNAAGPPLSTYRTPTDVDVYEWSGYSDSHLVLSHAGDWMRYTASVATSGTYDLQMRVAWGGTGGALGTFHVEVDGVDKTGP